MKLGPLLQDVPRPRGKRHKEHVKAAYLEAVKAACQARQEEEAEAHPGP